MEWIIEREVEDREKGYVEDCRGGCEWKWFYSEEGRMRKDDKWKGMDRGFKKRERFKWWGEKYERFEEVKYLIWNYGRERN